MIVQLTREKITMAFLGLFKRKKKGDAKSTEVKPSNIEPTINKGEKPLNYSNSQAIPPTKLSLPEIPPIKAPAIEMPNPPKIPNISAPISSKVESPQIAPIKAIGEITPPKNSEPFIATIRPGETKKDDTSFLKKQDIFTTIESEIKAPSKEKIKKVTHFSKKIKDELPEFTDAKIKEKELSNDNQDIPSPPHYLSHISEARKGAAEEWSGSKTIRKPIFVEVNDYRKVIEEIASIKKDSKKSKEVLRALDDFKIKNFAKLKKWEKGLGKIQRDLVFMDKILFEETG